MKSKWFEYKGKALKLRNKGLSIRIIENKLGVPRSTLSNWFKDVKLSKEQKDKLLFNWRKGLVEARKKAVVWHNKQKEKRLREAKDEALKVVNDIDISNKNIVELALAILYLGEGSKKNLETAIGSSDPLILKFFVAILKKVYKIDISKIKCELYLRADQNSQQMKSFWSNELNLPLDNFQRVSFDKRTVGSKTYEYYNGVCNVRCGNVAIQRKLVYLSDIFIKKILVKYK